MSSKPRKGICRVDDPLRRTRGWTATIRRSSGDAARVFSDGVYGGRKEAYRAASAWYVSALKLFPLIPRPERMAIIRRNNRTGVSGVYRWPANGEDRPGAYWAAHCVREPTDKRPARRKFSVACYGEHEAKALAIQARRDFLARLGFTDF